MPKSVAKPWHFSTQSFFLERSRRAFRFSFISFAGLARREFNFLR